MPTARRKSMLKQSSQQSGKTSLCGDKVNESSSEVIQHQQTDISSQLATVLPGTDKKMDLSSPLTSDDKYLFIGKMEEYNRRIQLPTFHIKGNFTSDEKVEYEGALRFFLEHAENNFTKAVRLTSSTTWKTLRPLLLDKFNLTDGVQSGKLVPILYAITENNESSVKDEECPLVMALNSCAHIQFVLKMYQQGDDPESPGVEKSNQPNSFFHAMKKKLHKSKSNQKMKMQQQQQQQITRPQKPHKRDPVSPKTNKKKRGDASQSSHSSSGSRYKSETVSRNVSNASSRKSSKDSSSLANSAAANARSMENLAKAVKSSKHKKKRNDVVATSSSMLAIDDTEEFITIHCDKAELGVDEVEIPIDGAMTVRDIIADVLEECNVSLARVDDFFLSDVIGRHTEGIWLTDYSREMNDTEKPLLLISMMKPSEGLLRRFEIKLSHKDDELASSRGNSVIEDTLTFDMRNIKRYASTSLSSSSNITDYNSQTLKFPTTVPYFLTVQSYDPQNDTVLHIVNTTTSILGSSEDEDKASMRLFAPDILPQHCWVCKLDDSDEDAYKCVSLAPFPGANVKINEDVITCKTNLKPGDVVSVGQYYVFLFKDPTSDKLHKTDSNTLARHTSKNSSLTSYKQDSEWPEILEDEMCIQFSPEKQAALISKVISIMSPLEEGFKLTPAYLFALVLDHARHIMQHRDLAALLNKICTSMDSVTWDSTKLLQATAEAMDGSNPVESLHQICPDLQSVLFWMANTIELRSYIADRDSKLSQSIPGDEALSEALSTLSDTITHAFQQVVYHITKVLYSTLDTILHDNPFARDSSESATMNDTVQTLGMIFDLCNAMSLNPEVTVQLFTYLYFFIGTSLCNMLFENDSANIQYNWEEGVKIRKNLEFLETWAQDNELESANNYLNKVIGIADFLATSKQFLLQASWHSLRNLFSNITPSQLKHLLENYDIGNRQTPQHWCPPSEEIYAIMEDGVMESFEHHPPLTFPCNTNVKIDARVDDNSFQHCLEYINSVFGHQQQSEDETDSGFDLGHSRSPTEVEEASKHFMEHPKCVSQSSNNSSDAHKPYTPIFKKRKDTPPVVRQRGGSNDHRVHQEKLTELTDNSSEDESDMSPELANMTLTSRSNGVPESSLV